MGPLVVDTVEDLRNIQQSLWEVSPAGSALFYHTWLVVNLFNLLLTQRSICIVVLCLSELRCYDRNICLSMFCFSVCV